MSTEFNEATVIPKKETKPVVPTEKLVVYDDLEGAQADRLILSELTVLRNISEKNVSKKGFGVVKTAVSTPEGVKKLAGIYNRDFITEEEAEDVVLAYSFENEHVYIVPRNSIAVALLS